MISVSTDKPMLFGGSGEPCAFGELISIGAIGEQQNKATSASLAAVVEKHCGVPPGRFYLKFFDVARSNFGWNGSTF